MSNVTFQLDNNTIPPPVDWQEVVILSRFDDDSVQANTDIDNFTFVNEAAQQIRNHISAGRIFEGIPFTMTVNDSLNQLEVFNGYVKTAEGLKQIAPNQIQAKISKLDDLEDVSRKVEGITLGSLLDQGIISNADYSRVDYVVERVSNAAELATLSITIYLMSKQLIDDTREIATETATILAIAAAGATGGVAALALRIALLAIRVAFSILLIIQLVRLIERLLEYLYPPTKTLYGMTFRRILEKVFSSIGYSFSSPIADLEWVYLPSKSETTDQDRIGIPNPQDYGYRATEVIDMVKTMFNARIRVAGNTIELRSLNDPFWFQQNNWVKPDVLNEIVQYNTEDMVSVRNISFNLDQSDFYTLDNYRGTSYEITTVLDSPPSNRDLRNIEGLDEVSIPVSLGTRKTGLTELERLISSVVEAVNSVISVFGGNPVRNPVKNRLGLLKISDTNYFIPKVVKVEGFKLPADYRTGLGAKYLYENYINQKSLVANNFFEQCTFVEGERCPFTLQDFLQVSQNKYFQTAQGEQAEMVNIEWNFNGDFARLDYKIHTPYTKGLREIEIEIV